MLLGRRASDLVVALLILLAVQQLAVAAIIKAKAELAPVLIERAWARSQARAGIPVKPWPWADTWPVARLQLPAHGVDQLIMAGDSGNVLAFGPGHTLASAPLGSNGVAVVGGHRDTHFAFAEYVEHGAQVRLELASGEQRVYEVAATGVVDSSNQPLVPAESASGLLLVTCYPFDTIRVGGPLRYLIEAQPRDESPLVL